METIQLMPDVRYTRSGVESKDGWVHGYAAVWDAETVIKRDGKEFRETIRSGAMKPRPVVWALWNHNRDHYLGSTENGTLKLEPDDKGMRFSVQLPNTPTGAEVRGLLERGDPLGASFGFAGGRATVHRSAKGPPLHEVKELDLEEVSITYMPAYPQTKGVRASLDTLYLELELLKRKYKRLDK